MHNLSKEKHEAIKSTANEIDKVTLVINEVTQFQTCIILIAKKDRLIAKRLRIYRILIVRSLSKQSHTPNEHYAY